jgi:hypothetical protein
MSQTAILPAPVLSPPTVPLLKFEREKAAFRRMLPTLLTKYRDKFVAIHEGEVVASGDAILDVADAAYAKVGYQPIYVDLVTDVPQPIVRVPSPRLLSNQRRTS